MIAGHAHIPSRSGRGMTPEALTAVQRSWSGLDARYAALLTALARRFEAGEPSAIPPARRAEWLLGAVAALVGLLPVPSRLAARAQAIGSTWPDPLNAPCFRVEGRAWMSAAAECSADWDPVTEAAWHQAWLLLSDVLAAEALSPFADPDASRPSPTTRQGTEQ
jgi:hypothetical protein